MSILSPPFPPFIHLPLPLMGFYSLASVFHTVLIASPILSFLKLEASNFYVNIHHILLHLISLRSQMKERNRTAWSELRRHQSWGAALYLHLFN